MAKRKIEMHEYRTIIYHLQQGLSVRIISKKGLAGRNKINEVKKLAEIKGWLDKKSQLPDDKARFCRKKIAKVKAPYFRHTYAARS